MTSSAVLIPPAGVGARDARPAAQGRTPRGGRMDVVLEVPGRDHAWARGEQSLATAARRVIVRRGIAPKRAIMFSGYWRVDGPRL
ncbi:NADPH-dependent ferric siderophore reductase [Micrococcus sp. 140720015-1]